MSHATASPPDSTVAPDLVTRLCAALPLGPYGLGLAASAFYAALFFAWNGPTGGLEEGLASGRRAFSETVNAVLFGYGIGAAGVARLGASRDLARLAPTLTGLSAAALERHLALSAPLLATVPVVALGTGFLMIHDPSVWDGAPRPAFPDPWLIWVFARNSLMGVSCLALILTDATLTRAFARIGAENVRIDLLDLQSVEPFVRKGQRSVVIWILFTSIFSSFWVQGSAASLNAPLMVVVIGLATAAFLLPLTGVRRSIRAAKRAELARVNDRIREDREELLGGSGGAPMANLIAYRGLVEGVHEWPLGAPALLRFSLFLLLGLGSWLGAALVERFLERALG